MSTSGEHFSNRFSVVAALAGSAIGLGNIWRFPYMIGEYGGALFVLFYLLCSVFIALPIFFSESIIGRRGGSGVQASFQAINPKGKWSVIGLLCLLTPTLVMSYYSIVGGWSLDYLIKSFEGYFMKVQPAEATKYFSRFTSNPWAPLLMHTAFLGITALIVSKGVEKGIGRINKRVIPVLFVLIVLILVYSLSLPGSKAGVDYLVKVDFKNAGVGVVAAAMGQSFFSLSLGMGTILVYSSYIKKNENIPVSGLLTVLFDTAFAILAAFAIMPAVFSGGIEPSAGPSLVFETLPYIFSSMRGLSPALSYCVPVVFFLAILLAAVTSEMSLLEVGTNYLIESKHMSRKKASWIVFLVGLLLGAPCSLSFGPLRDITLFKKNVFEIFDFSASNVLMFAGALVFTLFVGWRMKKSDVYDELSNGGSLKGIKKLFNPLYFWIKYVIPVVVVLLFVLNLAMS